MTFVVEFSTFDTQTQCMLTIVDFIQVQRHPTTAVSTSVWTSNEFVCMRDFGWYIFLVCIKECGRRSFLTAEEFVYSNTIL